ncbi:MAG: glycine zipper family protein [Nevskia sp.]|nr:glycine zipper family protein [Nevskia sp.]
MNRSRLLLLLPAGCLLAACVEAPTAPTVTVMPSPYKPFEVFVGEDQMCRQFAQTQVGQSPGQAANGQTVAGAVAGTAIGAASGALIGQSAQGAGVGAGVGLLAGTAAGSSSGYQSASYLQWRYNVAYEQCMYAHGNQVPGFPVQSVPAPPSTPPPPAAPAPPAPPAR